MVIQGEYPQINMYDHTKHDKSFDCWAISVPELWIHIVKPNGTHLYVSYHKYNYTIMPLHNPYYNEIHNPKNTVHIEEIIHNNIIRDDTVVYNKNNKNKGIDLHIMEILHGPMKDWDTSRITDMSYWFINNNKFNTDISNWDVSNVTNMDNMFKNARLFNQSLSEWTVSKVTTMNGMFHNAFQFDGDMSNWKTSNLRFINSAPPDMILNESSSNPPMYTSFNIQYDNFATHDLILNKSSSIPTNTVTNQSFCTMIKSNIKRMFSYSKGVI